MSPRVTTPSEEQASLAQDRLMRVASLTAMGEMAAGMAHELNQPLAAITAYAKACELHLARAEPDLAEIRDAVSQIGAEALRAARTIDRIRQFVRGEDHDRREPTDVNELIEELRVLLTADARAHDTRLSILLAPQLPRIQANRARLQQLVLNLARNAFEAVAQMPAGDRRTELTTVHSAVGDLEIRVSDNGPGISPQIQDRLFHPFTTTKQSGTGLGLAISDTIARAHGGTISVRPVEPHGASFSVCLPCHKDEDS
jgi:C4-dicarboxylate-specific signal transduction histidine kinase